MSKLQRKARNPYYDTEEFWRRWRGPETLEDIAFDLGISPQALWKAANRRGFPPKKEARGPNFKYKKRMK